MLEHSVPSAVFISPLLADLIQDSCPDDLNDRVLAWTPLALLVDDATLVALLHFGLLEATAYHSFTHANVVHLNFFGFGV